MDGFSHMVIPVENDGVCIVSLGDDVFATLLFEFTVCNFC